MQKNDEEGKWNLNLLWKEFMKGYRRDPEVCLKLISTISELLAKNTNQRFGQLLTDVHFEMGKASDMFYTTDEEFLEGMKKYIDGMRK